MWQLEISVKIKLGRKDNLVWSHGMKYSICCLATGSRQKVQTPKSVTVAADEKRRLVVRRKGVISSLITVHRLMATLVGQGFSYERPRCVSGGVGGQFRPEGWHQVWVGLIGRVGDGMWGGRGVGRLRLLRCFSRCRLEVVSLPFS